MTIVGKINCSKIDKSKLFDGKNGKMLDIVLVETPNNQYGNDFMIVQGVSKQEREQGIKGAILGNAKRAGGKTAPAAAPETDGPPPF